MFIGGITVPVWREGIGYKKWRLFWMMTRFFRFGQYGGRRVIRGKMDDMESLLNTGEQLKISLKYRSNLDQKLGLHF